MGRWDPRDHGLRRADDDPEQPLEDDDPPELHAQQRIAALEQEHRYPEVGPDRKRAIERELAYWHREVEKAERAQHWSAGAGDRTLF